MVKCWLIVVLDSCCPTRGMCIVFFLFFLWMIVKKRTLINLFTKTILLILFINKGPTPSILPTFQRRSTALSYPAKFSKQEPEEKAGCRAN